MSQQEPSFASPSTVSPGVLAGSCFRVRTARTGELVLATQAQGFFTMPPHFFVFTCLMLYPSVHAEATTKPGNETHQLEPPEGMDVDSHLPWGLSLHTASSVPLEILLSEETT